MFNIFQSKKSNGSITSALVVLGFNLLIMLLMGLVKRKTNVSIPKKRKYIEGEILE